MLTEFASLQLSREELKELHAALLMRAIAEDEVRRERGQEKIDRRDLLEKIEMLLGEDEAALHALDHALDDELWEYAWYVFTDEWAWFRAQQEVEAERKGDTGVHDARELQRLVEQRYQKKFDQYAAEVDMRDSAKSPKRPHRQPKGS